MKTQGMLTHHVLKLLAKNTDCKNEKDTCLHNIMPDITYAILRMGDETDSEQGRMFGFGTTVQMVPRHHLHHTHNPRSGSQCPPPIQKLGAENRMLQLNV